MLRRVALVWTDISEECIACIIRVTRIGELGTTLATEARYEETVNVPSHRRHNLKSNIFINLKTFHQNAPVRYLVLHKPSSNFWRPRVDTRSHDPIQKLQFLILHVEVSSISFCC
jgi:hypothetical protein